MQVGAFSIRLHASAALLRRSTHSRISTFGAPWRSPSGPFANFCCGIPALYIVPRFYPVTSSFIIICLYWLY